MIAPPVISESEFGGKAVNSHLTAKWVTLHVVHGLLVAVHIVAVVAALKGWLIEFKLVNVSLYPVALAHLLMPRQIGLVQTGVTAGLQVAFTLIVALVVSLAQEFAIDAEVRRRQHFTVPLPLHRAF